MSNDTKQRLSWIDTAKGLGIFFVVFGHSLIPTYLKTYIYSFHMPLFFFIAGLFFSPNNNFKEFIAIKSKKILVPYFIAACLSYLYWFSIKNLRNNAAEIDVLSPIWATIYGSNMGCNALAHNVYIWFLPCLFIVNLIFYFTQKLKSKSKIIIALSSLSVLAYFIHKFVPFRLPWCIDIALIAVMFFGIGSLAKNYVLNKLGTEKFTGIIVFVCLVVSVAFSCLNTRMDFNGFNFGHSLIYLYISAFTGIAFWLYIARLIPYNKAIIFIGKNSLIVFLIQYIVFDLINGISSRIIKYPISNSYAQLITINPTANPFIVSLIYTSLPFIATVILIYLIKSVKTLINKNLAESDYQPRSNYE